MNRTKIDWATMSWNPITGCLHGCPYCYARNMAHRYAGCTQDVENIHCRPQGKGVVLDAPMKQRWKDGKLIKAPYPFEFTPTFHRYRLDQPARTGDAQTIFVCSMADLLGEWVPLDWIRDVLDACLNAPKHRYLFLTKNPSRYIELNQMSLLPRRKNFWYGSTVESMEAEAMYSNPDSGINSFWSMEPLLGPVDMSARIGGVPQWVIIGAETGNRKSKVIPRREWVEQIADFCAAHRIPIFYKDNLRKHFPDLPASAFPWEG